MSVSIPPGTVTDATSPLGYRDEPAAKKWSGPAQPRRVLAIRLQAMGDTVITLPYLAALARALPRARIDLLTREEVAEIPLASGIFDRVFALGGGRSGKRQLVSACALLPALWARRYDVVVDLQRNPVSQTVRRLLRPHAFSEFDRYSGRHAGERTLSAIEAAGLGPLDVRYDVAPRDRGAGVKRLRDAGWDGKSSLVVLNPAGALPGRNWPTERWGSLAEELKQASDEPPTFLLLGLPALAGKAEALKASIGPSAIDLVGRTSADEAFALVAQARLVVSEDSGLLHMAWVAGRPTLALFGASPTVWARPMGPHTDVVEACRRRDGPCVHGYCERRPPACLERLESSQVVERALRLLQRLNAES